MKKKNKIKKSVLFKRIFVWFVLLLMTGSVIISIVSPLLWG